MEEVEGTRGVRSAGEREREEEWKGPDLCGVYKVGYIGEYTEGYIKEYIVNALSIFIYSGCIGGIRCRRGIYK